MKITFLFPICCTEHICVIYTSATFSGARALKNLKLWAASPCPAFSTSEGELVSDFHLYVQDRKKIWSSYENDSYEHNILIWLQNEIILN